ncbi:MAG: hypothetical protein PHV74_02280 [Dehalococcoidia bacterium]|nr:hypothetical protein [Dehalococcoidia bacterium]
MRALLELLGFRYDGTIMVDVRAYRADEMKTLSQWFDRRRNVWKWAIKVLLLLLLVLLVLFPRVDRLPVTIHRYFNPNSLVDPQSPALDPLIDEFEKYRQPDWSKTELMNYIEAFVYYKIPYAYDWNTWANADYLPTVEEVIKKGKEDCDGRAVLAASMLRRYGFDATLAGNFQHIWVKTEVGETMGPGERSFMEYTEEGRRFNWDALRDMPNEYSFNISVFPLWRELIIAIGAWLILKGRHLSFSEGLIWLGLAVVGLLLIRGGGYDSESFKNWLGSLILVFAVIALVVRSYQTNKRESPQGPYSA